MIVKKTENEKFIKNKSFTEITKSLREERVHEWGKEGGRRGEGGGEGGGRKKMKTALRYSTTF